MGIILSIFALLFALPALAQERAMPSYLVVLGVVTDRAKVGEYAKALAPIYATNGGRYVGIGGPGNRNDAALELARISNKAKSLTTGFVGDYTAMEGDGPYNRVELLAFPSEVDRIGYLAHPSVKEFLRPRAGLWVEMLAIDPPPLAPAAPPPTKTP
jgi:uncharacterized protein (DUF1330 family)